MLDIAVIVYGIYTVITGKFTLLGGRKLDGWRGRVCGAILLCYLVAAFVGGIFLALTGNQDFLENGANMLLFTLGILVLTVGASFTVGHLLYYEQETSRTAKEIRGPSRPINNNFAPDDDDNSPYRPPRF